MLSARGRLQQAARITLCQAERSTAAGLAFTVHWLITRHPLCSRAFMCPRQHIKDDRAGVTWYCKPSSQGNWLETLAVICSVQLLHTPGTLRNSRCRIQAPTGWSDVASSPHLFRLRRPRTRGRHC